MMAKQVTLHEMLCQHGINAEWTFTTYFHGVHTQSPRTFASIEDVIRAVVEKLTMHALDHEFPMISLVRLPRRNVDG